MTQVGFPMLRPDRIRAAYPNDSHEAAYLLECARRLDEVFAARAWSVERGLALVAFLNAHSVQFSDGFVIGDDSVLARTIGYVEAELITAAIAEDLGTADWWQGKRRGPHSPRIADATYLGLVELIRDHPGVVAIL